MNGGYGNFCLLPKVLLKITAQTANLYNFLFTKSLAGGSKSYRYPNSLIYIDRVYRNFRTATSVAVVLFR